MKKDISYINNYIEKYIVEFKEFEKYHLQLLALKKELLSIKKKHKKVILVGNGGSSSIAGHVSIDFTKVLGIPSLTFNQSSLLTCFSNDYGYEYAYSKAIEFYGEAGDLLIAISSSGKSENIINACKSAKKMKFGHISTFTGFKKNNPVDLLGDTAFWVDSMAYNYVENFHQFLLLLLVDLMAGVQLK